MLFPLKALKEASFFSQLFKFRIIHCTISHIPLEIADEIHCFESAFNNNKLV